MGPYFRQVAGQLARLAEAFGLRYAQTPASLVHFSEFASHGLIPNSDRRSFEDHFAGESHGAAFELLVNTSGRLQTEDDFKNIVVPEVMKQAGSRRNIRRASSRSLGLPRICPLHSTTVSAASRKQDSPDFKLSCGWTAPGDCSNCSATCRAFSQASRSTRDSATSPAAGLPS